MKSNAENACLQNLLQENYLLINHSRNQILYSHGDISRLEAFFLGMRDKDIFSFAGNINFQELRSPMVLYRTGGPGRYWTSVPPLSPWQSMIDLAMPYSLYPETMRGVPNWYPANQGVLIYTAQPGELIARGSAARQGPFPGGTEQIYLPSTPKTGIHAMSWEQWHSYNICSYNYKPGCRIHQFVLQNSTLFKLPGTTANFPPIKVWDIHTAMLKSPGCQLTIADSTLSCRPGFYDNLLIPAYKKISYERLFGKALDPALMVYDVYNRIQHEIESHPNASTLAKSTAIGTGLTLDYLLYAVAAKTMGPTAALAMLPVDLTCNLASVIREIPTESMRENRALFMVWAYEITGGFYYPEEFMKDFDKGAEWTRNVNENIDAGVKTVLKPFAVLQDIKNAVVNLAREAGEVMHDGKNSIVDWAQETLLSSEEAKKPVQVGNEELNLAREIIAVCYALKIPDMNKPTEPGINKSSLPTFSHSMSIHGDAGGTFSFGIPVNSGILSPDFHSFLSDLSEVTDRIFLEDDSKTDIPPETKPRIKPEMHCISPGNPLNPDEKKTFISDLRLAPVGAGVGVIASLYEGSCISISFQASSSSFFTVSATFGEGAFTALGAAIGMSALVGGVLIAAQHLYTRQFKHVQHKIKHAIRKSDRNIKSITEAFSQFSKTIESANSKDFCTIINDTQKIIEDISAKMKQESKFARYAGKHKQYSTRYAHNQRAQFCHKHMNHLSRFKTSLELEEQTDQFVRDNQGKTSAQLIDLAKTLTEKSSCKSRDIAEIEGLKQLIVSQITGLTGAGKLDEAKKLLQETFFLQFYFPGNMEEFSLGQGVGTVGPFTARDVLTINDKIQGINELIGSGTDPNGDIDNLITFVSELSVKWTQWKDNRKNLHSRKSADYVSSRQWDDRIQFLHDFVVRLKTQKTQFANGIQPASLELETLTNFAEELSFNVKQTPDFWFREISNLQNGSKVLSKEEKILFKMTAFNCLIACAINEAFKGDFDKSQTIVFKMNCLLPEHADFYRNFNAKLNELKPFLHEKSDFWLKRIHSIGAIPEEKRQASDLLELDIAFQFTMNEVFQKAIPGKFAEAEAILRRFPIEMPEQKTMAASLISKIQSLKSHYQDVEYCMTLLTETQNIPEEKQALQDHLQWAIVNHVIQNDILSSAIKRQFKKANNRTQDYVEKAGPRQEKKILAIKESIKTLELLAHENNSVLLEHYRAANPGNEMLQIGLHAWIIENIFRQVAQCNHSEAIGDLENFSENPNEKALCDRLITVIKHGEDNKNKKIDFWLEVYQAILAREKDLNPELDPHAETVLNMNKLIPTASVFAIANQHSEAGFHLKAAKAFYKLSKLDPDPQLKALNENALFAHEAQLYDIFITKACLPFLTRTVNSCQPSWTRSIALGALEATNIAQIIHPNALSLSAQALQAQYAGAHNMEIVLRNTKQLVPHLSRDLNPWHPDFKLLNPETLYNGARIYAQLGLQALRLPLERICPKSWQATIKNLKETVFYYGSQAQRFATVTQAAWQLKTLTANSPLNVMHVASALVDWCYSSYQTAQKEAGRAIEDPGHYLGQNDSQSFIECGASVAFVTALGGIAALPLAAAFTLYNVHRIVCASTEKEATLKALFAALSNIDYNLNIQAKLHYIKESSLSLLTRKITPEDIKQIKSSPSTIFLENDGNSYTIHFLDIETNQYERMSCDTVRWRFLKKLSWSSGGLLENKTQALQIRNNLILTLANSRIITEYLSECRFIVSGDIPDESIQRKILEGEAICFVESSKKMYIKSRQGTLKELPVGHLSTFSALKNCSFSNVFPGSYWYEELFECAVQAMVNDALHCSTHNIGAMLENVFKGLTYNPLEEHEVLNIARIIHFDQLLRQKKKNSRQILDLTSIVTHEGQEFIHHTYRFPPHLVWHLIVGTRLLAFAESRQILLQFYGEYQKYSQCIYDSAEKSPDWFGKNWENVKTTLGQIVSFALQQYIIAAANTAENKLAYLSLITKEYRYLEDWRQLLKNDELKFLVAIMYQELGKIDQAGLFYEAIEDIAAVISTKTDDLKLYAAVFYQQAGQQEKAEICCAGLKSLRVETENADPVVHLPVRISEPAQNMVYGQNIHGLFRPSQNSPAKSTETIHFPDFVKPEDRRTNHLFFNQATMATNAVNKPENAHGCHSGS